VSTPCHWASPANFLVNGRDYLVPMAIEEPSVVAAASYMARLVRQAGGFQTSSTEPVMIAQMQVLDLPDPWAARFDLLRHREQLLALANQTDPVVVSLGGGARDLEVRVFPETPLGPMLVVHLLYDCRDAMGAKHRQHRRRGANAGRRGDHRRARPPPHPVKPGRPAAGPRQVYPSPTGNGFRRL